MLEFQNWKVFYIYLCRCRKWVPFFSSVTLKWYTFTLYYYHYDYYHYYQYYIFFSLAFVLHRGGVCYSGSLSPLLVVGLVWVQMGCSHDLIHIWCDNWEKVSGLSLVLVCVQFTPSKIGSFHDKKRTPPWWWWWGQQGQLSSRSRNSDVSSLIMVPSVLLAYSLYFNYAYYSSEAESHTGQYTCNFFCS